MSSSTPNSKDEFCKNEVNSYPFYSPRFWAGMGFPDYMGMMMANRFRVHPMRWAMALAVGGCAATSSCLATTQRLFLNRKIRNTELTEPPVFVIGHWRSGTTLLHELLAVDDQFTWPNTFECFVPTHHLLSRPLLQPLVRLLMPGKRPMDAMPAGPQLPQEDEFALVGMGAPTPYYHIAFCNQQARYMEMLNLKNATDSDTRKLREALTWFYKTLTYRNAKRLVLKSPTHTGRIAHLAKWFPGARFVHITRHPYKVFPSTIHLWASLAKVQGYQFPSGSDSHFVDYVHQCYREMYEGYFDQVEQIPSENLIHIKFEDLVQNPIHQIGRVYSAFDLSGFEQVQPKLERFWSARKSHRTNNTQLSDQTRSQIDDVWSDYIENFGYAKKPIPTAVAG